MFNSGSLSVEWLRLMKQVVREYLMAYIYIYIYIYIYNDIYIQRAMMVLEMPKATFRPLFTQDETTEGKEQ